VTATFKLEGFKEFEKALAEEFPKATSRNILRRTATNAMEHIRVRMGDLAPRDEADKDEDGRHLADSMRTQPVTAKRARGSVKFDRSTGVAVMTGPAPVGKRARANAGWQEYGTVKQAANAYARPAADAEAENVIGDVSGTLASEIGKVRARVARKAARSAKG
jgi:hypothetical protein